MFSLTLAAHYEQVWLGENPSPATFPEGQPPLLHQWRTYNAEEPLIINTYNTGTGKTKAAFLRLLKRARDIGFNRLSSSEDNALLIAPTNELLAQHARDAETFCTENDLPYQVVPISRADLDDYKGETHFSEVELRRGAALHYLIQNARQLGGDSKKKATLFVVNPDIFYYALFFCYHKYDRIPLFQDMLTQFNFIIIDEFHYYNSKQFANFLFFMSLSKHYGFTHRQFCLLTATPDRRVTAYLEKLGLKIKWIIPDTPDTQETEKVEEVGALAPVTLEVYSEQELLNGIVTMASVQHEQIATWLQQGEDGAIISSALWRINQIYYGLKSELPAGIMGRLTGAEKRKGRTDAKGKRLILATPTVDIGYNFDRQNKPRQNIDFLLLDARTSDEFIQRLGRAGRVLGKEQQNIPSRVLTVVNQKLYEALQPYEEQTISRTTLRALTIDSLPSRHSLYNYIQSGSIAEVFLPIYRLEGMVSSAEKPDLEELYNTVRQLFAPGSTATYKLMRAKIQHFISQDTYYSHMQKFPAEIEECLAQCEKRIRAEQEKRKKHELWVDKFGAFQWLQEDLREYFTEKARFSFREAFQPPPALVSDPKGLLSSEDVALYDALHIAKNYHAHYHKTLKDWQRHATSPAPQEAKDALVFCDLLELRQPDERIQIGLKLIAGDYRKSEWEEHFVYRSAEYCPTALYGMEAIALNSSRTLDEMVQNMFKERYIPVFIAADPSRTLNELRRLQRDGQIFPYELHVTFGDLKSAKYYAVLGTTALLVWAEIQRKYRIIDESKGQKEDNDPIFC